MKLQTKKHFGLRKKGAGIALFILLASMILISLVMQQLFIVAGNEGTRVRNYGDRIQAIYLARSTLNLSRFFITYDHYLQSKLTQSQGGPADGPFSLWAAPVPFPVPMELLQSAAGSLAEGKNPAADNKFKSAFADVDAKQLKNKCESFFDDFQGQAMSQTTDLNSLFDLNTLNAPYLPGSGPMTTLTNLLQPNADFVQMLNARGLRPEQIAREIRDYSDSDDIENETNTPETGPYNTAQLPYGPKNYPYTNIDELKLIPSIDDELFEYLSKYVSGIYIASRQFKAKINLNTVSKNLFQALLKNVSNPEAIAEAFIKDRTEKKTVYNDQNAASTLQSLFQLGKDQIPVDMIGGTADAFQIETDATVNDVQIRLTTYVAKGGTNSKIEPIMQMRVTP